MLSQKEAAEKYTARLEKERERGKQRRDERKANGLVPVTVWIQKEYKADVKAVVQHIVKGEILGIFKVNDGRITSLGTAYPQKTAAERITAK